MELYYKNMEDKNCQILSAIFVKKSYAKKISKFSKKSLFGVVFFFSICSEKISETWAADGPSHDLGTILLVRLVAIWKNIHLLQKGPKKFKKICKKIQVSFVAISLKV